MRRRKYNTGNKYKKHLKLKVLFAHIGASIRLRNDEILNPVLILEDQNQKVVSKKSVEREYLSRKKR